FLSGVDLLVHDGQYVAAEYQTRRGWGHSTVEYALEVARLAGVGELVLTHHDPLRDDDDLDQIVSWARERPFGGTVSAAAERPERLRVRMGSGVRPSVLAVTRSHPASRFPDVVTDWLVWPASVGHVRTKLRAAVLRRACRWQCAPLPADEVERLQALRALG